MAISQPLARFSLSLGERARVRASVSFYNYGQTNIPASAINVVAIAVGASHCLAIKANGTVVGWGNNFVGEINIPASANNVIAVAAGDEHSLALRIDGVVIAWGNSSYGLRNIPAEATNVVAIGAGLNHNLAVRADAPPL